MQRVIINARIVTAESVYKGNIFIDDQGRIEKISADKIITDDYEIFDAGGNYVLPGLIEVHGHFREPGFEQKGDVPHESRAAAAGGFTTVLDMPNTNPPTTTVKLLRDKIEKIYPNRSHIDYAFFMGVSREHLEELKLVDRAWIVGFKVFMAGHETSPATVSDDKTLAEVFKIAAKRNIRVAVHAEDQWLINYYEELYKDRHDPEAWSLIRPKEVIVAAVARAIALAETIKNKLYLLHLSTTEEFALVDAAKKRGAQIHGELVGYQLFYNAQDYKKYGNKIKVAPASRRPEDQARMWDYFREGRVDVICSEHTPHEWETKNQPDMRKAQAGQPGIQEMISVLITKFLERYGKNTLEEVLKLIANHASKRPAEIFGFTSKGSIEVGKDADLVVLNLGKSWTVSKKDLFSKCGWSNYEGMKLVGRSQATFLRGNLVYQDGKIIGKPQGKWLKAK